MDVKPCFTVQENYFPLKQETGCYSADLECPKDPLLKAQGHFHAKEATVSSRGPGDSWSWSILPRREPWDLRFSFASQP